MPFRLAHAVYIAREVERARGVLVSHMEDGLAYTPAELVKMLKDYGLEYSSSEYQEIGAVLLAEGFLETT